MNILALLRAWFVLVSAGGLGGPLAGITVGTLRLINQPFTAAPNLDPTTLVESTTAGLAASAVDINSASAIVNDPATGDQILPIPAAANGNVFIAGMGALPQVIYGAVLASDTATLTTSNTIAVLQLTAPISINGPGDGVIIDPLQVRIANGTILVGQD